MRFFLLILISSALGCSASETTTPTSYGNSAGQYFINEFKDDSRFFMPTDETAKVIADYCANLAYDKGLEMNWTMDEILKSSDACTSVIVEELFK